MMSDERPSELKMVPCRRTGQEYDCNEHVRCPYCFGEEKDVETGDHEQFCDFEPGKDPVSFGFPDDIGHFNRG
jgi:hypothetical protein